MLYAGQTKSTTSILDPLRWSNRAPARSHVDLLFEVLSILLVLEARSTVLYISRLDAGGGRGGGVH